jgi:hypothetical protein
VLMMERRGRMEVEARDFTSQTVGLCHTSLTVEFTLFSLYYSASRCGNMNHLSLHVTSFSAVSVSLAVYLQRSFECNSSAISLP